MKNQIQESPVEGKITKEEVIDNILEFLPSETTIEVELPSLGQFYKGCGKTVKIRPMTFADEKAIVSARKSNINPINLLLGRCVDGVDISNLLTHDKIALTLKLREISYGEEYKAVITCDSCEFDNHITFNVSKLDTVFFPEEFEHPIPVTLPTIKKDILLKLPRVADEDYLLSTESLGSNLWRFITEIDGHSDPIIISKVVEKLPLKDIHTIINTLGQAKYGIQTKVKFECQKCASFTITELPITSDFFTVS
jgi:hypothetical protein